MFAKMVAGNYMVDFVGFRILGKYNRAVETPRRSTIDEITAHFLAGATLVGKVIRTSSSGGPVGPMTVGGAKL